MIVWKRGITREVIILGNLIFKLPSIRSYRLFLTGLLCNLQERLWWNQTKDSRLCPVLFSDCFGLLVIMPKVVTYSENFSGKINYNNFNGLPLEQKPTNFGIYNNKYVLIDYGS